MRDMSLLFLRQRFSTTQMRMAKSLSQWKLLMLTFLMNLQEQLSLSFSSVRASFATWVQSLVDIQDLSSTFLLVDLSDTVVNL